MPKITNSEVLNIFPLFFETNLNEDGGAQAIFENLEKIFEFDDAFIYFANPESLQLKYSYNCYNTYSTDITFPFNPRQKKLVYSEDNYIADSDHQIVKLLRLEEKNPDSSTPNVIPKSSPAEFMGYIILLTCHTPAVSSCATKRSRPPMPGCPSEEK